ncbi:MAG: mevalonate kinase [Candidatus Freyarchaeota archaeon]|nr:mevalonate kinase [Candidatus Jordarchaeia archaeon]MBS7268640.1 mevalonate kinase [Candidatus Jordarchaeia archaeon]MBS7279526.1 mevalonate kinase [Candidatus Jordarchaeia archaeon]
MRPERLFFFGEHAVVYGEPALVASIDKRVYVSVNLRDEKISRVYSKEYDQAAKFKIDKSHPPPHLPQIFKPVWTVCKEISSLTSLHKGFDISIKSEIPPGAGLGSSAAVSVATAAALNVCLDLDLSNSEISSIAFGAEKTVHGTPSGIDNTIATYGGAILYEKGNMKQVKIKTEIPLVIGNSGVKRSTAEWVGKVKLRKQRQEKIMKPIIKSIGLIVMEGLKLLDKNDFRSLGELMDINQGLLEAIGVSTFELDKLINAARQSGAYGAKLTGAGGGGCMIALSPEDRQKQIADAILKAGGKPIITNLSQQGVKIE